METESFNYMLDECLIANAPAEPRDTSRLLIVSRRSGALEDRTFRDIGDMLGEDDVLVLNETKVIKARLKGFVILEDGREKPIEIVLLSQKSNDTWECAVFPGERLKPGKVVRFKGSDMAGTVESMTYAGRVIRFSLQGDVFFDAVDSIGSIPLPPYIKDSSVELDDYNTVFADEIGSCAAPTAGLHFTHELLERLASNGVRIEKVLLHVGLGTFKPITEEDLTRHEMHKEYVRIDHQTAERLNGYKSEGKRIIAVGTTVVRTLESFADENGILRSGEQQTDIFLYPGRHFRFVDSMITNFHLPKSSLLMLVSAFHTREGILKAYAHAQENRYRFYSFGDAMWIM